MKTKQQSAPDPAFFNQLARWFGALAEPNRLHLIWCVKQAPQSVSELVAATGLSQPLVSKHLATLREAGLLAAEKRGQQVIYSVADPALLEICQTVCGSLERRNRAAAQLAATHSSLFGGE